MEQVERTYRYLMRIRAFYKGIQAPYHSVSGFEDDMISFFMHCYHIRDWVIHLNKKDLSASSVDKFINENMELKICADFCNGSKHYKLTRGIRTEHQPTLAVRNYEGWSYASITSEFKQNLEKANFSILANGKEYDSLELAEKCYFLWKQFIESHCT